MPLIKSGSKQAISSNISDMIHAGHPRNQAIAAALDTARRYGKKYAEGGDIGYEGESWSPGDPQEMGAPSKKPVDAAGQTSPELGWLRPQPKSVLPPLVKGEADLRSTPAPTVRERIASWMVGENPSEHRRRMVGETMGTTGIGSKGLGVVDATPLGMLLGAQEEGQGGHLQEAAMNLIPGVKAGRGVLGAAGKTLLPHQESEILGGLEKKLIPPAEIKTGSPEWFDAEFKGVLQGNKPSPQFNKALEEMVQPEEIVAAAKSAKHTPEEWEQIVKTEKETNRPPTEPAPDDWYHEKPIPPSIQAKITDDFSHTIKINILNDFVNGVSHKEIAQYFLEFAKQSPEAALQAKSLLPKEAKSDLNKALWSLHNQKGINAVDKQLINDLYVSKLKAKKKAEAPEPAPTPDPFEQVPFGYSTEQWSSMSKAQKKEIMDDIQHGTTPDDIEAYLTQKENHELKFMEGPENPALIARKALEKHPGAGEADPELSLINDQFLYHTNPFPHGVRKLMLPDRKKISKLWGLNQEVWHATKSEVAFDRFKLPEDIPLWSKVDNEGNVILQSKEFRKPELGIHGGTLTAAHQRVGEPNVRDWGPHSFQHNLNEYQRTRVMPVLTKANNPLELPDLYSWGPQNVANGLRNYTKIPKSDIDLAMHSKYQPYSREREVEQIKNLRRLIESNGYDSVVYINRAEDPGSVSFINWKPEEWRSPTAKFKNKKSSELTAGIAGLTGGGVLYPYYRNRPTFAEDDDGDKPMKKGGRAMASGGFNASQWIPRPKAIGVPKLVGMAMPPKPHVGLIRSTVPGRTDKIGMNVKGGSYVIPASVVSGLGEGNSSAGAAALDKMFGQGPYGSKLKLIATPRVNFGKPTRMPIQPLRLPKPRMPRMAANGGAEDGENHVPIIAAGGEYLISPEVVRQIGGGDLKHGHSILDELVLHVRRQTIKDMKNEKAPKK